jgi:hypothetical protein
MPFVYARRSNDFYNVVIYCYRNNTRITCVRRRRRSPVFFTRRTRPTRISPSPRSRNCIFSFVHHCTKPFTVITTQAHYLRGILMTTVERSGVQTLYMCARCARRHNRCSSSKARPAGGRYSMFRNTINV